MSLETLEKLETWQKAKGFAVKVYKDVLPLLPREEKWGLNSQLRRAAASIPANIAEGHGRYYYQENIRFCYIACGSLEETVSHLSLANDLGYIQDKAFEDLIDQANQISKMINGYIAYLKKNNSAKMNLAPHVFFEKIISPMNSNLILMKSTSNQSLITINE